MSAQDLTEDEEAEAVDEDIVEDVTAEDEDDEAEVEDDENTELVSRLAFDHIHSTTECVYNSYIIYHWGFVETRCYYWTELTETGWGV